MVNIKGHNKELYKKSYFNNRIFENKYYYMSLQWIKYLKPLNAFDMGCGQGFFVHAFNYYEVPTKGYDISESAISNAYGLSKGCISTNVSVGEKYELVVCSDVLEHIPAVEEQCFIDTLISLSSKHIVCSICDITLKDAYPDPTHCNLRSRAYWIYQFEKRGWKSLKVPDDWYYHEQLYIFERDEQK